MTYTTIKKRQILNNFEKETWEEALTCKNGRLGDIANKLFKMSRRVKIMYRSIKIIL